MSTAIFGGLVASALVLLLISFSNGHKAAKELGDAQLLVNCSFAHAVIVKYDGKVDAATQAQINRAKVLYAERCGGYTPLSM